MLFICGDDDLSLEYFINRFWLICGIDLEDDYIGIDLGNDYILLFNYFFVIIGYYFDYVENILVKKFDILLTKPPENTLLYIFADFATMFGTIDISVLY